MLTCTAACPTSFPQLWLRLTKCFGKFKTWLAFNLTTAVSNGLFVFIGRGDPKLCMILAILNGAPSGAQVGSYSRCFA